MSDDHRTLIDAAVENIPIARVESVAGYSRIRAVVKHPNSMVAFEDLERFADAPARIKQIATHETPRSFSAYVNAFGGPSTRIFASLADMKVVAAIDYHSISEASWATHKATYPAVFAPAFAAWHAVNEKPMPQKRFAEFLEDRAEVAARFEAVRNVDFKSAINISTGERQFRYEEKDSPAGAVACPKIILLQTPVFQGSDPVRWAARLAYDISDGKLSFTVKIHRLEELLNAEFERLCDAIAVDCPRFPIHRGKAV